MLTTKLLHLSASRSPRTYPWFVSVAYCFPTIVANVDVNYKRAARPRYHYRLVSRFACTHKTHSTFADSSLLQSSRWPRGAELGPRLSLSADPIPLLCLCWFGLLRLATRNASKNRKEPFIPKRQRPCTQAAKAGCFLFRCEDDHIQERASHANPASWRVDGNGVGRSVGYITKEAMREKSGNPRPSSSHQPSYHSSRRSFGRTVLILDYSAVALCTYYPSEIAYHTTAHNIDSMSSYYSSPPTSPASGFFPSGPASPHAFASFHQSPRDNHSMYAAFGASHSSGHAPGPVPRQASRGSGSSTLKRLVGRN